MQADPFTGQILALDRAKWEGLKARRAASSEFMATPVPEPRAGGRVAVLPIQGPIEQHYTDWLLWYGGTSTDATGILFDSMMRDSRVKAIILNIESPGGSVPGTPELANKIYNARGKKPIIAIANSMAASAALWIGSAATEFVVTPSGEVGSHGVWALHVDYSRALEADGLKPTFIQAGKYKTEGNPYEPLGSEAQAEMQRGVDSIFVDFTSALAKHRGISTSTVLSKFGQGRMLFAKQALAVGLVDAIATLEEVVSGLAAGQTSFRKAGAQFAAQLQTRRLVSSDAEADNRRKIAEEARERQWRRQLAEHQAKRKGLN